MTISRVGSATGITTATLPAHQAGDFLLAFAFRDGSTTAPTIPTGSGWINSNNGSGGGGSACSYALAYKIATTSSEAVGTWTNATSLVIGIYRGVDQASPIGAAILSQNAAATSIAFAAVTLNQPAGSWVVGVGGHVSPSATAISTVSGTSWTYVDGTTDTTDTAVLYDSNGTFSGTWAASSTSPGLASGRSISYVVEIQAQPFYAITLSPSSATIKTGETYDLTAYVTNDNVIATGAVVTASSANTTPGIAYTYSSQGYPSQASRNVQDNLTVSTLTETSPLGNIVTRFTETIVSSTTRVIGWYSAAAITSATTGDMLAIEVEVRTNRDGVRVDIGGTNSFIVHFDLASLVGTTIFGTAVQSSVQSLVNDWYRLSMLIPSAASTINGAIYVQPMVLSGGTLVTNYTSSSTDYYIDLGRIRWYRAPSTGALTDSTGNVSVLTIGKAIGTTNVTATVGSVTSSPTAITVIDSYQIDVTWAEASFILVSTPRAFGYVIF